MSIAFLCVLIAALIPYVLTGYAKFSKKGYNNNDPRTFLDSLEGKGKRAHYAQLNSFEAFPAFAAAVIIAQLSHINPSVITVLSVAFIFFRILYCFCYISDKASLRSVVWFFGFACVMALFIISVSSSF